MQVCVCGVCVCVFHVCVQQAICQLGVPSYEEKKETPHIFMKVGGRIGHKLLKAKCRVRLGKGLLQQRTLSASEICSRRKRNLRHKLCIERHSFFTHSLIFSFVHPLALTHLLCSYSVLRLSSSRVTERASFPSSRDTQIIKSKHIQFYP